MGTGLDEKARKELLEKMISLREPRQETEANCCKDSSSLNEKANDKTTRIERDDKNKTSKIFKILISLRLEKGEARVGKARSGQRS